LAKRGKPKAARAGLDPHELRRLLREQLQVHEPTLDDRVLWCLVKGDNRAEAVVRVIRGTWVDLRYLLNGKLRASQLCSDDAQLQATAAAKRNELLARGWVDPGSLAQGR
jgi:hypothetical protein